MYVNPNRKNKDKIPSLGGDCPCLKDESRGERAERPVLRVMGRGIVPGAAPTSRTRFPGRRSFHFRCISTCNVSC